MKERKFDKSEELHEKAKQTTPGGVHSGARSFKPFSIFMERGEGSKIYDADGNEYIDYLMSYGPNILGHGNKEVNEAVKKQLEKGICFGSPSETSAKIAKKITQLIPCIETVKFSNSGGECVAHVVKIARAYTGKDKVIKFEGGYHGCTEAQVSTHPALSEAGPENSPTILPNGAGLPKNYVDNYIVLPWNNPSVVEKTIKSHSNEIAAVLTEPILGNTGTIMPEEGYLETLREITQNNDVLLIFDEVITGFRVNLGGAQKLYGITPDLSTFAKAVAGGFPLSGYGGRKDIMEEAILKNGAWVSGTYNANPLSMAAASATLNILERGNGAVYEQMTSFGKKLVEGIEDSADMHGVSVVPQGPGPFFHLWFTDLNKVTNYREAVKHDAEKYHTAWKEFLREGVYYSQGEMENWFLSAAHTKEDIDTSLEVVDNVFGRI
ncbi:MAG: aspartate aminotransferase family protein [Theionarchaea archaeon]|nr:aspartate aminotransferase family protein [Theionarchaea archaeon]